MAPAYPAHMPALSATVCEAAKDVLADVAASRILVRRCVGGVALAVPLATAWDMADLEAAVAEAQDEATLLEMCEEQGWQLLNTLPRDAVEPTLEVIAPPGISHSVAVPITGETEDERKRRDDVFFAVLDTGSCCGCPASRRPLEDSGRACHRRHVARSSCGAAERSSSEGPNRLSSRAAAHSQRAAGTTCGPFA